MHVAMLVGLPHRVGITTGRELGLMTLTLPRRLLDWITSLSIAAEGRAVNEEGDWWMVKGEWASRYWELRHWEIVLMRAKLVRILR